MKTVCANNQCMGCMACVDRCGQKAIVIRDDLYAYNAVIDPAKCVDCGACTQVCPSGHPVPGSPPMAWYQGWAGPELRPGSSSGGAAAALMKTFWERGGYVAACRFDHGAFSFLLTKDPKDLESFAGSKYVKSNPAGIYSRIQKTLREGHRVLFIGLPCQVAAVRNWFPRQEELYTVDLICHGTPSPGLLERYLGEQEVDLHSLQSLSFRRKTRFALEPNGRQMLPPRVQDLYTRAFLTAQCYTENCYSCPYAAVERVSDITLGDSWGSELSREEQDRGISLILCQTEKGKALVQSAGLVCREVALEKAVAANHQLRAPAAKPAGREVFFRTIHRGFHKAMAKSDPGFYYKQVLKSLLIRLGMIR